MSEFSACAECGHTAWAHGDQSGFPPAGAKCHAAMDHHGRQECSCKTGYQPRPESKLISYYLIPPSELVLVHPGETPPADAVQMIPLDVLTTLTRALYKTGSELLRREADHYGYQEQGAAWLAASEVLEEKRQELLGHRTPKEN